MDGAAEEDPQVHQEAAEIEKTSARFELDEEIDVAAVDGLTSGDGAENAKVGSTATGRDAKDFVSPAPQVLEDHLFPLVRH
jgi:hypothetical protein